MLNENNTVRGLSEEEFARDEFPQADVSHCGILLVQALKLPTTLVEGGLKSHPWLDL